MESDFTLPEHKERRRAFRVTIAGYRILVHAKDKKYPFHGRDISVTGISFIGRSKAFKPGVVLAIDIVRDDKVLMSDLRAGIVWAANDLVGCAFKDLSPHQEDGLSAIVLVEQKRMAAMRKTAKPQSGEASAPAAPQHDPNAKSGGAALDLAFDDPWSSKSKK